jgi:hypothetical protein
VISHWVQGLWGKCTRDLRPKVSWFSFLTKQHQIRLSKMRCLTYKEVTFFGLFDALANEFIDSLFHNHFSLFTPGLREHT